MKLLQVIPYYHPAMAYGGPVKVVYEFSQQLAQSHQLAVWTSDTYNAQRRLTSSEKDFGHNHTVIHHRNLVNAWAYQARLFTHYGLLITALKKINQFDLIHLHDVYVLPQLLLARLSSLKNIPYVCSPHGVLDPTRTNKKSFAKLVHQPLVKSMLHRAKRLIATSQKEANDLKKLGFTKVTVIENGIALQRPKPKKVRLTKTKPKQLTLLYIGKLHPQKGLTQLLQAISQLKTPIHLIIAGPDDGSQAHLIKTAKKIKHATIDFTGFVDEAQKEFLYERADLFVYPSHSEGFSISILEAMRAGLPVLITNQCNFPAVSKKRAGIIVDSNKIQANLARSLKHLTRHPEKLKPMGKIAQALITKQYSIKAMAQKIETLYDTIV